MKKAVLFDLFGTLVPSPPLAEYRQMVDSVAEILNIPPDNFFDPWMDVNDGRLNGSFGSSEAEISHAAEVFGVVPSLLQMDRCMEMRRSAVSSWVTPKPGAIAALDALSENNRQLALVSDCVFDVPAIWPNSELAEHFDVTVFSCELGIRKPDRRMYETALSALGVGAQDSLFVGDGGSGELDGASALGIDAVLLDDRDAENKVLRVDVREWAGPTIRNLSEVAHFIGQ